jgi:hypothetical protein
MQITNRASIINSRWRYDPDTGFLRCTAGILKAGVMVYAKSELADSSPPEHLGDTIRIYVSQDELENQDSVTSLEGAPASVNHIWQSAGNVRSCGSIAGRPFIDGDHLVADILITDSDAVRRIMLSDNDAEKLTEISSAGDWGIVWQEGVTEHGEPYDGYFTNIRFNHVALLPAGAGRAGASVRIINTKEVAKMEFTRVKLRTGQVVRVANEDVRELEAADAAAETEVKNAVSPEELQGALDELTALKAEVGDKNARISELEGVIQTYKDQLEAALSPDQVEEAAAEMTSDREEAAEVMNSNGLKLEEADKKLRGHALRSKVVNSVRVKNGKTALSADQVKDEAFVRGMYSTIAELGAVQKPVVTGANVVTIQNDKGDPQKVDLSDNAQRAKHLYGRK